MAVEVYHESVRRRYYASHRFSLAYLYFVVMGALLIVIPFFLAYSNVPSFWLKTNTYREQPKVQYEYKILGLLQGRDASGLPLQIAYSSMSAVSAFFRPELRVPTLRSIEVDKNRDGLTDRFHLEALIPLRKGEEILASSTAVFFDVKLRKRARIEMEAVAVAQGSSALAGSAVLHDGDFVLNQKWPLRAKGGYQTPYENTPLLDPNSLDLSVHQALFPRLVASYRARNQTLDFESWYNVWSPIIATRDDAGATAFNLTLNLRVPVADVLYTPTATEVLKDAWIKYLSVFVVVAFLLDRLSSFIFYNQLLDTTMCLETPHSRAGEPVKPR